MDEELKLGPELDMPSIQEAYTAVEAVVAKYFTRQIPGYFLHGDDLQTMVAELAELLTEARKVGEKP